jgi:hypothetical protein
MENLSVHADITDPSAIREFAVDEVGKITSIGCLPDGTSGGNAAVHIVMEVEGDDTELDGLRVRGYTTLALLRTAVRALEARYP